MKRLIPIFLLVSSLAFAQGGARSSFIVKSSAGQAGTVRVCTGAATGTPCSPLASIYSDAALTIPLSNPITTDAYGNYSYYAAPGTYKEQTVVGSNTATFAVSVQDPTLAVHQTGNENVAGTKTFTNATGTAPFAVNSTTKVTNLNADSLDGNDWANPAALGSGTPAPVSATTLAISGNVSLSGSSQTITQTQVAASGGLTIQTAALSASTGSLYIKSGAATGAEHNSGTVTISTGGTDTGGTASGDIILTIGTATGGTNGAIKLQGATQAQTIDATALTLNGGNQMTAYLKTTVLSVDLASVASGAISAIQTTTVTGAALGDTCWVDGVIGMEDGGQLICNVTATDTVKWYLKNNSGGAIDRASQNYVVRVLR